MKEQGKRNKAKNLELKKFIIEGNKQSEHQQGEAKKYELKSAATKQLQSSYKAANQVTTTMNCEQRPNVRECVCDRLLLVWLL